MKKQEANYIGYMSPTENGATTLFDTKKFIEHGLDGYAPIEVIGALAKATSWNRQGGMKPAQRLRVYDKYVPALIKMYFAQQEVIGAAVKDQTRVVDNKLDRSGKRWDQDEDDLLIELACNDDYSLDRIAISMGRSAGAIQSRLTYLVGIKKISSNIAGRFVGTLNGENVNGFIAGELQKVD